MRVKSATKGADVDEWLDALTPANAACIRRLISSPAPPSFTHVPKRKQAAVAALLYQDEATCELRVIMTTRALHLRSHPGQASLPGGKVDNSDSSVVETALRESVEEIGLPATSALHVYTGHPFLSKLGLLVHPVGFLVRDARRILTHLVASPDEVSDIWSTSLRTFLSSTAPRGSQLADPTTVDRHRPPQQAFRTYTDVPWLGAMYRLHRFRSSHQLIKGLTADVLISIAHVAYGAEPKFEISAPGQRSWNDMVQLVVQRYMGPQRAEQRWGDGESGDAQGSSEAFETHIGHDYDSDTAPTLAAAT